MAVFDELAEKEGDNELEAWLSKIFDAKQEIVGSVTAQRQSKTTGGFDGYLTGSFNLSLVKFSDGGPKAGICFPKSGHTAPALREEKVRNEVDFLELLWEKTTIPIPRVVAWGLINDSPQQLGPFAVMDFIDGVSLATVLKQPTKTEQDEVILGTNLDETEFEFVYEQLADFILQLSRLEFPAIGALSREPSSNEWNAGERPLTYNMNELETVV